MAYVSLTSIGKSYTLIPEGTTTFKIMMVDDSYYDSDAKIGVRLQTATGQTHIEWFNFRKRDGSDNMGAMNAWSFFVRKAMNDYEADGVDTDELVGKYITADVTHDTYTARYGQDAGKTKSCIRLKNFQSADGFTQEEKQDRMALMKDFIGI